MCLAPTLRSPKEGEVVVYLRFPGKISMGDEAKLLDGVARTYEGDREAVLALYHKDGNRDLRVNQIISERKSWGFNRRAVRRLMKKLSINAELSEAGVVV